MEEKNNISFDKLRALAEGKLPKQEQEALLLLLKQDEESRLIYEGLVFHLDNEEESIDSFISRSEDKLRAARNRVERKSNKVKSLVYWISSAAAILILAFTSYNYLKDDLSDYDFKDAGLAVTLSVNQDELKKSMNAYKLGNNEEALTLIESQLANDTQNDTLNYYMGVIRKELGSFDKAIESFNAVKESSKFFQKAEYQLAYCYIQEENSEESLKILKRIVSTPNHAMHSNADDLLKYIDQ